MLTKFTITIVFAVSLLATGCAVSGAASSGARAASSGVRAAATGGRAAVRVVCDDITGICE